MNRTDKRELILKAAGDCFSRYGYDKTTLEDIGRSLGLNKASLYYYFKNKDEIFIEVVLHEAEKFISSLQSQVEGITDLEGQLSTYLVSRLYYYQDVLNLHQLTVDQVQHVQPRWQEVYKTVLQREEDFLLRILNEAKESGQIKTSEKLEDIASALLTVSIAIKHDAVKANKQVLVGSFDYTDAERKTKTLVRLICKGMQP